MVKSMFAAISGLQSHQSRMDIISNNIANVNTWGYKSRSANFQDAVYQELTKGAGGNVTDNGALGGINSSQLGFGVNVGSISTNFGTGSWGFTGDGSNVMIDGTGFFIVGGWNGAPVAGDQTANFTQNGLSLSRVGIFSLDNNGALVDNNGNYIYGFSMTGDVTATPTFDAVNIEPIVIPDVAGGTAGERYQITSMSIGSDGVITGIDDEGTQITIGKIALASVENMNGLVQSAGYLYDIGPNAGNVIAVDSGTGTVGRTLANYLELSNVDLATAMADMIVTQRGYQANTKIITVTDEMLEQLVNMKR